MWYMLGLGLLIGFVWGMLEERRKWRKAEPPSLYYWDCPSKDCVYHVELEDRDAARTRVAQHLKKHLSA